MAAEVNIWSSADMGRILRERRRALGLRQAEAAAALGFSTRLVSEIENGRSTVGYGKILRYAEYLAMDVVVRERG